MSQKFSLDLLNAEDREYFVNNKINLVKSGKLGQPILRSFTDSRLPENLRDGLAKSGFVTPTPIQAISISTIFDQQDFIGISKTGSGKTLSFLVPIITKLLEMPNLDQNEVGPPTPYCVILTPTRELAQQIYQVIVELNVLSGGCVYGGDSKAVQTRELQQKRPPIVVATPGRLKDMIQTLVIDISQIRYLVLDEADRMLDMGFRKEVEEIISYTSKCRQTMLFSATFDSKVEAISRNYMDHERIVASVNQIEERGNADIVQRLFVISDREKHALSIEIFRAFRDFKILVFCNTKAMCDGLANMATQNGFTMKAFHSDSTQASRNQIIRDFATGKLRLIAATDAMARGIDISDINLVVNYDFPTNTVGDAVEQFVHRTGRTGRAGRKGLAYSFITQNNIAMSAPAMGRLAKLLQQTNNTVPTEILACKIRPTAFTRRY